jgi:hypothetical protein
MYYYTYVTKQQMHIDKLGFILYIIIYQHVPNAHL